MRTPLFVPAAEIDDVWALIEPWLQTVAEKRRQRWSPEDIRSALKTGTAGLFVLGDGEGKPTGCVVTTIAPDWGDRRKLHVWAAFNEGGFKAREWWPFFEAHAREMGCALITFFGRSGWGRVTGARSAGTIWELEL